MKPKNELRILIVEDDPPVSQILQQELQNLGYAIADQAADGREVVELVQSLKPDLILIDLDLPEMAGVEAIQRIFQHRPTPVVALAGAVTPELVHQTGGVGAYLLKPVAAAELERAITVAIASIADIMALRRLNDELAATNAELQREIAEHKQAEEKRAAHERFLTLLNDITYTTLKTTNLQEMLQILADRLGDLIGADGCFITLWDEATQTTIPAAASGEARQRYGSTPVDPNERTMTQSVLEEERALVVEDVFNTPYLSPRIAALFSSRSLLALPLIANRQKLGAALIAFDAPHQFGPDEVAYGEQAAQQVALAVAKARLLEALKESEERYHDLFEYATDAIFIETLGGDILAVNEKACQLLGYSKEELLSLKVEDIIPGRTPAQTAAIRSEMNEKGHLLFEGQNRRKDGSLVEVEVSIRLIGLKNQEIVQVFVRDITERKQMAEQLQQLKRIEAVSTLAGGIAHDFNNIMTIITGNCELILSSPDLDPQLRRDIEKVNRAGQRAAKLTNQLLTFSRRQMFESSIVDLNTLVRNMGPELERLVGPEIVLTTTLEATSGLVEVDPDQFEQALINLVSNAGDVTPAGGQVIIKTADLYLDKARPDAYPGLPPGPYIMLAVQDTGNGIDSAAQARIFDPFFTTKETGQGSGLGLAIVYGVVKQCGGHIQFHSEPDRGTTFKIFLPQIVPSIPPERGVIDRQEVIG